jgi:hypothetical protein
MATTKKPTRTLYLGAWIDRLGLPQNVLANRAGITEGYLANLIRYGAARSPSAEVMLNIAAAISDLSGIKISVDDLYERVPPQPDLEFRRIMTTDDMLEMARLLRTMMGRQPPQGLLPGGPRRRGPGRKGGR